MQDNITPLVTRIAEIKAKLAPMEAEMKPLATELEQAKLDLMTAMQQGKSKRTETVNGYYVIRAERKTVAIADQGAVEGWLVDNGHDLDQYKKLDTTRVKAAAESAMKENGEIVPGIEVNSTEYLTIKAA